MTDMTDDRMMAPRAVARPPRAEFAVYFALIFALALPVAVCAWAMAALGLGRPAGRRAGGPVRRALAQARAITPVIFSA